MSLEVEIGARIEAQIPRSSAEVAVDGDRAVIRVVSEHFRDMSRVRRQQAVYACIQDLIASGTLHAVQIKTETPPSGGD